MTTNQRDHRLIREVLINATSSTTPITIDVETLEYESILVTWWNADAPNAGTISKLICCPTNGLRATPDLGNFPSLPTVPAAGASVYYGLGASSNQGLSMPAMITIGLIPATGPLTAGFRIEGDRYRASITDIPTERQRA